MYEHRARPLSDDNCDERLSQDSARHLRGSPAQAAGLFLSAGAIAPG